MRFPRTSIPRRTPTQDGLPEAELCTSDYIQILAYPDHIRVILRQSAHHAITMAVSSSLQKTINKHFDVAIIRWPRMTSVCCICGLASHVTIVFFSYRISKSMPQNLPKRNMMCASIRWTACLTYNIYEQYNRVLLPFACWLRFSAW